MDSLEKSNARKKKFKMAFTVGGQLNAGLGNNKYTRAKWLVGTGISPGITFQNSFSLSASINFTRMNVNEEYGPPYENIFNYNKHDYYTTQLLLELRVFPLQKSQISPVAIIAYGKGSGIFSRYLRDGDCWKAGAGLEIKVRKFLKIDLTCIYNYQDLKYNEPGHSYQYEFAPKLHLPYTGVNIGFIFLVKGSRYARSFLVE